jgi:hypothetical protein
MKETLTSPQRVPGITLGPLLREVIQAQQTDHEAVSYPQLRGYAAALQQRCRELDDVLVWPVGDAAERLTGAAVLFSKGGVRVRGWSEPVSGERVLLVAVAAATPLALVDAAIRARALGATEVHACGIAVTGAATEQPEGAFASYTDLSGSIARTSVAEIRVARS